jgi:hypothetical protein
MNPRGYSDVIPTQSLKGSKMNIAKNMEAIAIVAITLACVTTFALAGKPEAGPSTTARIATSASVSDAPIQTVTVIGRRLTTAEKAQYSKAS